MGRMMITGSGMVASAMVEAASLQGWDALIYGHEWLDVTDAGAVRRLVIDVRPEVIIHTAALTRVNYCEDHRDEAFRVNRDGTGNIVNAAAEAGARLVYFSTDYVFNGQKSTAWTEGDSPDPLNVYGASKLAGEELVRAYDQGTVLRTSGVFGSTPGGLERNFFKVIAAKLKSGADAIPVIDDQFTAVTYAPHLARMLLTLLPQFPGPVVHMTSGGHESWYGWASRIAGTLGLDPGRVTPVTTAEMAGATTRPRWSVMESSHRQVQELISQHPAQLGIEAYFALD